jgi:hypothetical protein
MGSRRLESLFDMIERGAVIRASCRCGHTGDVDPNAVLARVLQARRGSITLSAVYARLRCTRCGRQPSHVQAY